METQNEYYVRTPLRAEARPIARHRYCVSGRGEFPYDMLRYDAAWPADSLSAALIADVEIKGTRCIVLYSYRAPTMARWSSFLWSVHKDYVDWQAKNVG